MTEGQFRQLQTEVEGALRQASQGLSDMVGRPVQIEAPQVTLVPTEEVAELAGGPEKSVVGVYLGMTGQLTGHALLVFTPESASLLADLVWDRPPAQPSPERSAEDLSALAEVGNLTASYFFNYLSDRSGLTIAPTTPVVVEDMLGALLDSILAELSLYGSEALLLQTVFSGAAGELTGQMIFLPHLETLNNLMEALGEHE